MALAFTLLVAVGTAHGVPGKLYSDMTVSNSNSDNITSEVVWKAGGFTEYAAIGITDNTGYSPHQTFTNAGNITLSNVSNSAFAFIHLIGNDNDDIDIHNQGNLSLSYGPNDGTLYTYGIRTDGNVVNGGNINLNIHRQGVYYYAWSWGINCQGDTLTNTGNINLVVNGGSINSNTNSVAIGTGIYFNGNTMTNSGDISVHCTGGIITSTGTVALSNAVGVNARGTFHHTGTITARAVAGKYRPNSSTPYTGEDSTAYGIKAAANLTLNSEGLIWASAQPSPGQSDGTHNAYQVYVDSGTTTITGYSMELSNQVQFDSTYKGAIKVNTGAGLAFSSAVLYLSMSNSFTGEVEYEIPMLEEGAVMADQFASLGPIPPEYQVELIDGNGAALQKVKFTYAPVDDPAMIGTEIQNSFDAQEHAMIRANVSHGLIKDLIPSKKINLNFMESPEMLLSRLSRSKTPLPDLPAFGEDVVFAGPVFLTSSNDSTHGYEAKTHGILAGYTRHLNDHFYVGGHAGISDIDIHFTGTGEEQRYEDTLNYSLGGHLLYLHDKRWLFTAIGSLFYGQTDYWDNALHNRETADYESYAVLVDLAVGRFVNMEWFTLMPEVGVSTSWNYRESFTTDNQVNADVRHGMMEEVELFGKIGVEAYAHFDWTDGVEITPHLGLVLTQTFTDGKSDSTMGVGMVTQQVTHQTDRTTISPTLTLTLEQENVEVLAGFSGAFSKHTNSYLFWLEFGVSF
ncbi:MAG: autotransporter domain-containing protein [Desulfobacterales bacterium]|nr:autotransporter domain-containing protein [Desulfobacterales bacterium]